MSTAGDEILKRQIVAENMEDYALWAHRFIYIRDKSNELITLSLNHVQQKIDEIEKKQLETRGNARLYILKGRQGGVSTDQQARALHTCIHTPGANALTLAHSRDDTDKLFGITRRAVKEMVSRFQELIPTIGRSEAKEVTFPGIDSNFWTGTAGARRIGRGITLTRFHGSEFAFWDKPRQVLASVAPAMIPYGSVIALETTPDMEGSEAHQFWNEAVEGKNEYTPVFFPWWECDPVNYRLDLIDPDELGALGEEETVLMASFNLTLEHIKWRRAKIKELGKLEFIREYPEDPDTCWITGGKKFYDPELVWRLLHEAPKPIQKIEAPYGGTIQIFDTRSMEIELPSTPHIVNGEVSFEPRKGKIEEDVIIGSDVAEGSAGGTGDRTTWTARGFPSWRLLSTFASKTIEPPDFAFLLFEWGMQYGEALLVVEKNQHGITVLRKLRDLKYPRRSIYHRTPLNKTHDVKTDYIGWATTGESKPLLLDAGREILRAAGEGKIGIPSREALRDAWAVADGDLTGRDVLASEMLCWVGREYLIRRRIKVLAPIYW